MSYGRDLWDCLGAMQDNSVQKTLLMKNLKSFFSQFKKAVDVFTLSLNKALLQYEKDFVRTKQDQIVDTLSTAMCNVKLCLDDMMSGIIEKSELIQRDLIEPLTLYYKHY